MAQGRASKTLKQKLKNEIIIGVDLGGSHCSLALVNKRGKVFFRKSWPHDPESGPDQILGRLMQETKIILNETQINPVAIGVGLPGNIDPDDGICRFSPNFFGWKDVPVKKILFKGLRIPVEIENDVRSAALGEATYGAGLGLKSFVFMALGTGIGGGVILNGKLWIGTHRSAGEIGHITIEPDGPLCNCGNHGCLEALASGPAISAMAAGAMMRHRHTILSEMVSSSGDVTAELVARAAYKGDSLAIECFKKAGKYIGIAFSDIATIVDPEKLILGGGVSQAGAILINPIKEELEKRINMFKVKEMLILSRLGKDAPILGAAAIAAGLVK